EAKYILEHSGAVGCVVGKHEHFRKIMEIKDELPQLGFVVAMDPVEERAEDGIFNMDTALLEGKGVGLDIEASLSEIGIDHLATIMYTSGTTGPPKGVMLSHGNFLYNVHQALHDFWDQVFEDDVLLSFLPLSHSLERTAGYYMPMAWGAKVAFAEDFSRLQENLLEVRPTCIVSVPRLYEKIRAGVLAKVAQAPDSKKRLFEWGMNIARQNLPYVCQDKKRGGLFAIKYAIADRLIFSKLKRALGMDRLRFAVSGGGPLSVGDAEFFLGMGIVVLEGYGLTETTPITNVNRYYLIKPGTVGPPVPGTTIRLSEEGEVLIKGPQVMKGYYRDEKATREVFTDDGFFRSGDVGVIDQDGYLAITDRLKEIIVTSGGKNISPQNIE
ncbi:MAG: AMP-dependent synthetase/ligase, partial [Desulfatiglandales bacterium]